MNCKPQNARMTADFTDFSGAVQVLFGARNSDSFRLFRHPIFVCPRLPRLPRFQHSAVCTPNSAFESCIHICIKSQTGRNWLKKAGGTPGNWRKNARCPCEHWKDSFSRNLAKPQRDGFWNSARSGPRNASRKVAGRRRSLRTPATIVTHNFHTNSKAIGEWLQVNMRDDPV
jgi:hypothetical protein